MFKKITGIVVSISVVAVIVMVTISGQKPGLFLGKLDLLRWDFGRKTRTVENANKTVESRVVETPTIENHPTPNSGIDSMFVENVPSVDSVVVDIQRNTHL